MTNLQSLIETTESLVKTLDQAAQNEKQFALNVCIELEKISWQFLSLANDLREIKEYCGV